MLLRRSDSAVRSCRWRVASMVRRLASTIALVLLIAPASAWAQIHQVGSSSSGGNNTISFTVGAFTLKGLESRPADDVLVANLLNAHPLLFEVKDLNSVPVSGEYLLGIGRNFEAGVGLGFSQRTVTSVYSDLTHSNGNEIVQDLKLRQVPVTFTGRFLILPR